MIGRATALFLLLEEQMQIPAYKSETWKNMEKR